MNVFLLPHHPLDPRYRYCLEREHRRPVSRADVQAGRAGIVRRFLQNIVRVLHYAKLEYDYLVHGHEQIRLSRLVLQMSRDPELTIVVPSGMSQQWALEAVRGVIRTGLMRHRAHVGRNLLTALFIQVVLVIIIPTHVLGLLFLPVVVAYGFRRYREDVLIRENMEKLLNERLANGVQRFREDPILRDIDNMLHQIPQPHEAYKRVLEYLDICDGSSDGIAPQQLYLVAKYYSDIGRWDPYERFQDRAIRSVVRALQRAKREIIRAWTFVLGPLLRKFGYAPPVDERPSHREQHQYEQDLLDDEVSEEPALPDEQDTPRETAQTSGRSQT